MQWNKVYALAVTLAVTGIGAVSPASAEEHAQALSNHHHAPNAEVTKVCDGSIVQITGLESWNTASNTVRAQSRPSKQKAATLLVNVPAQAELQEERAVRFIATPGKLGRQGSYGGFLAFPVKRAGTYRIALAGAAWVDVIKDGKAVASIAHSHGPDCSGVRKVVDFSLEPGRYQIQLSASKDANHKVMVALIP